MMTRIVLPIVALVASAAASDDVNVFLCDSTNAPRGQKSLSHGQGARICFTPVQDDGLLKVTGVESFVVSQENQQQQVVIRDGAIVDSSVSQLDCDEEKCVLQTYLDGNYFMTGKLSVGFASHVQLQKSSSSLRGNERTFVRQQEGEIDIKTHPLPVRVHARQRRLEPEPTQDISSL